MKKCLNDLSPPEDSSTQDVLEHYKKVRVSPCSLLMLHCTLLCVPLQVIVEIGDHINACLAECVSEEEGAELRA